MVMMDIDLNLRNMGAGGFWCVLCFKDFKCKSFFSSVWLISERIFSKRFLRITSSGWAPSVYAFL